MVGETIETVIAYDNGTISKEQFWQLCQFKYPTHQICFCTEKALEYLEFAKAQEVGANE